MRSSLPKVMHPLAGQPMIQHLLATVQTLQPDRLCVVIGDDMDSVRAAVAPAPTVVQSPRLGTGHAVMAARPLLDGFDGTVLVVYGDTPLLTAATLQRLLDRRARPPAPAVVVLGFRPDDAGAYGRLVVDDDGGLHRIIEAKDATPAEIALDLCNSGVMAIDGRRLFGLLDRVGTANAKGEYYLTDIVGIARADGQGCAVETGSSEELQGINSRAELALAEGVVQRRLRARAMAEGATLVDPDTVYFSADTRLGEDVIVGPAVVFGPAVTVGNRVRIHAFCHITGAVIGDDAEVGPFARLRPGAELGRRAHVGNFVELKNTRLGDGAKANHLTYLGDAGVGSGVNVGAGTITCNYDGFFKERTEIGDGAFIGSNTSLVAPVRIGDGAIIGAGSVITRDVGADALALTRAPQDERPGWAGRFREIRRAQKAAAQAGTKTPQRES
jgi:bifunctional UDP-N-acetylglucosamine pyrophosphorylase/glucosamine-1-phosphate N-acetyltransferase